ncbi:tRNA (adenosine(37)-N6)-dimethylallyltransferase MiaA [Ruminococcaceae bacterium OttesenSCG-928-I18]|nr:tRNA (adenosine(37)-N6)-dimethylallyltransferase MiaA [Ruminococcaceae bacterium OttesenSCG-928-I18]
MGEKKKIVVLCGPTASGKTELAFALCRRFNGELVGADSMQLYEGLPIGTAAPLPTKSPDVPRHLIGFLPPSQPFSVAEYVQQAEKTIFEILSRGRLPLFCGGTGLYIDSLVNGVRFTESKVDESTLTRLDEQWSEKGADAMLGRLAELDPEYASRLHPSDKKRIVRALAESETGGTTLAQRNEASRRQPPRYQSLQLALTCAERKVLYGRIEARIDQMLENGLLEEAKRVFEHRESYKTAVQAIGYKEFFPFFEGHASLESCTDKLKQATRNYAKRQLTWFRNKPGIQWLYADKEDVFERAAGFLETFLRE